MLVRGRGRYPRPPPLDGARRAPLCRRLVFPALPGLLARLRQPVERALDASNHAGGDARIARCRIQLVVTQKRLDDSNIGTALEQVRREAVAQSMERHGLLDPGGVGRLVEQAAQLAGRHRLAGPVAGKQPAFLCGRSGIVTQWACLPPLAQQIERLRRQHHVAVLAALRLFHPNDLLRTVDMLDLQPDYFASTQAAAITETEQHADLEVRSDGQQALGLVRAHHQRNLLGPSEVIDLGGKIQSPQRYAQQEPQPGHNLVAGTDAQAGLGQVQLKLADILKTGHPNLLSMISALVNAPAAKPSLRYRAAI